MEWATQPDGRIDSVPFNIDPWVLYYNKEMFDAKGVAYPRNFAEIVDAAAKLTDPGKGVSGFVARGLKNANVPVWASFLLGNGGGFVDRNSKLLTDTPEAIEAARMYQVLLTKYGPPGVAGFNWNESQSLFSQGRAAMWLDGIGFAAPLEDPAKSRIVGKVGYGVMPPGPRQQVSAMYANGHGISAFSKKKQASWLYVQWASNKTNQARLLQAAAGAPVHNSAYDNPEALAALKVPKAWVECMVASARISQPGLPAIGPVTEFRDVIGIALTNMINGADPATEMKKATTEFQPVLDKSERA
jgi:multiple sugar transport system substrate-binding protein